MRPHAIHETSWQLNFPAKVQMAATVPFRTCGLLLHYCWGKVGKGVGLHSLLVSLPGDDWTASVSPMEDAVVSDRKGEEAAETSATAKLESSQKWKVKAVEKK